MKKVLPSERLFKAFDEQAKMGDLSLSEIIRIGAQMALQRAVELEVSELLGRGEYENAQEETARRGRRNGYESKRSFLGAFPLASR